MSNSKPNTTTILRQGFSLLEVVLVIAIIAIVAALAAPRFARSAARYHIDLAARRIVQDLSLASRQARNAGATRTMVFDGQQEQYSISDIAGLGRREQPYRVNLQAEPYGCGIDSVNFGGNETLTFDAFGRADSGGQVVLKVGDFTRTITFDADSGKASVQ